MRMRRARIPPRLEWNLEALVQLDGWVVLAFLAGGGEAAGEVGWLCFLYLDASWEAEWEHVLAL